LTVELLIYAHSATITTTAEYMDYPAMNASPHFSYSHQL
jgi:hypothetical protein